MNFEPQEFFIGLMDLFTILLPGALLTYFLHGTEAESLLPKTIDTMSDGERWAVVVVSSYLLGHFLFLLGSWLDEFYDFVRGRTFEYRVKRLCGRNISPRGPDVRCRRWCSSASGTSPNGKIRTGYV